MTDKNCSKLIHKPVVPVVGEIAMGCTRRLFKRGSREGRAIQWSVHVVVCMYRVVVESVESVE